MSGYEPPKLNSMPGVGTKRRAKLEAMNRPGGAETWELQQIDGNGGYGTYKNDCKQFAGLLGKRPEITGKGLHRRYELV